jgi:hypothetical protein
MVTFIWYVLCQIKHSLKPLLMFLLFQNMEFALYLVLIRATYVRILLNCQPLPNVHIQCSMSFNNMLTYLKVHGLILYHLNSPKHLISISFLWRKIDNQLV